MAVQGWELEVDQGERVTMDSDGNEQQEDPAREAQLRALLEMGAGAHLNPAQRASLLQPLSGGSHLPPLAIGPSGQEQEHGDTLHSPWGGGT